MLVDVSRDLKTSVVRVENRSDRAICRSPQNGLPLRYELTYADGEKAEPWRLHVTPAGGCVVMPPGKKIRYQSDLSQYFPAGVRRAPFTLCYNFSWSDTLYSAERGGGEDFVTKACTTFRPLKNGKVEVTDRTLTKPGPWPL